MTWYKGETLLEHLEAIDFKDIYNVGTPRFPVQSVIRPKTEEFHDFRGYAGKVYGGELSIGDTVLALPSKIKTKIKSIYFYDQEVQTASRRSSVTITLEDEINISRGDMITKTDNPPVVAKQFTAKIAWMDQEPLTVGNKYVIQHGVNKVLAKVDRIHHHIKTDFSGITEGVSSVRLKTISPSCLLNSTNQFSMMLLKIIEPTALLSSLIRKQIQLQEQDSSNKKKECKVLEPK